jgi:predicted nuclease of restriction endonuclease-like (RecB) superfamily
MKGFSARNLLFMRSLAEAYDDEEMVKQLVSQIPWGHNIRLMQKVKDADERRWYLQKTLEHGWSRSVLILQIDSDLRKRQGSAPTNFDRTLPPPPSDLAQQVLKDPYVFDFLTLSGDAQERELEQGLVGHIRDFLLELGVGFSFVGTQVQLEVGGQDFCLDMLFYHLTLRCFVVIELKAGPFAPEYTGKLNFYLSAVDDLLRHPADQPTIGILLCKEKNNLLVEYALRDMSKPIGVANWETRLVDTLPDDLKGRLPTVEEMEAELMGGEE